MFMINNFGWVFLCITFVLARIIMIVTQIVRRESLKDIVSEAINSVTIEYDILFIRILHIGNIKILRVREIAHI